jgi:hypothetical protein
LGTAATVNVAVSPLRVADFKRDLDAENAGLVGAKAAVEATSERRIANFIL